MFPWCAMCNLPNMQASDLKDPSRLKEGHPKVEFLMPACELLAEQIIWIWRPSKSGPIVGKQVFWKISNPQNIQYTINNFEVGLSYGSRRRQTFCSITTFFGVLSVVTWIFWLLQLYRCDACLHGIYCVQLRLLIQRVCLRWIRILDK